MRSMLNDGQYNILVDGQPAGFLRVSDTLAWFLGAPWRGTPPRGFSVNRVGPLGSVDAWKRAVNSAAVPFARGQVARRSGGFPSKARQDGGGGLLALDFSVDDAYAHLQLDPGVVGIWQGLRASNLLQPTLGFGYAEGTIQVHTEVFAPMAGTSRVDALTVRQLEAATNTSMVVRAFQRLTRSSTLDYARGAAWQLSEYRQRRPFWAAVQQAG